MTISGTTECPECEAETEVTECPDHKGCPKCRICGYCDICALT
jgi:hypothetical protein